MQNKFKLSSDFFKKLVRSVGLTEQEAIAGNFGGPIRIRVNLQELELGENQIMLPIRVRTDARFLPNLNFKLVFGQLWLNDGVLWAEIEQIGAVNEKLLDRVKKIRKTAIKLVVESARKMQLPVELYETRLGIKISELLQTFIPELPEIKPIALTVDHGIELVFE